MFTLIALGTGVAWVFSLVAVLFPSIFPTSVKTDMGAVPIYFEAAAVITTLVLLGRLLELKCVFPHQRRHQGPAQSRSRPGCGCSRWQRVLIALAEVVEGDWLRVKPGEKIPVDGVVIEGGRWLMSP